MPIRLIYFVGLLSISLILGTSIYFQIVDGIMPCPLCILQRFTFGLIAVIFIVGFFTSKHFVGRMMINLFLLLASIIGMFLTGRQIWLQHYGDPNNAECGVSLQYMLQALPFDQVVEKVFAGTAECTQRGWEFLHLNMAEWALLWFALFFLMAIYLCFREIRWHDEN